MHCQVLERADIRYLDRMLIENGLVRPVRWKKLRYVNPNHIKLWCTRHGVFQVPTWELIEWLKYVIDDRWAIEVGSGKACLGRHLRIPMTDSCIAEVPLVAQFYWCIQQAPAISPPDVERLSGNDAVIKYRPQIVVGSWITQWSDIPFDGNYFGINEERILDTGATYILIGNIDVHGRKRIMRRSHLEFKFPWLVSRGFNQNNNRIWIWNAR